MKPHDLIGKMVLITGASSGLGAATAIEAARRGAHVALVGRNDRKLLEVHKTILSTGGRAHVYVSDITSADHVEALRSRVERDLGSPYFLINNAGAGRWAYLEDSSYEEVDQMIDAPLRASLYITRAFLPGMLRRNSGAVGNVSSIAAFLPWSSATTYTSARWALRGLHEALRADLKETNLSATLAATAAVQTEYFRKNRSPVPVTPSWIPMIQPERFAKEFLDALVRRQALLIMPRGMKILRMLHLLFPNFVDSAMRESAGQPRPK